MTEELHADVKLKEIHFSGVIILRDSTFTGCLCLLSRSSLCTTTNAKRDHVGGTGKEAAQLVRVRSGSCSGRASEAANE